MADTDSGGAIGSRRSSVSVFGLGYVGCVSVACLAALGHRVVGVDVNPAKTAFLRRGESPVVEERIGDLVAEGVRAGLLTVGDAGAAVLGTDVTLVCVGTPSAPGGGLSTLHLERVTDELGAALAVKDDYHTVAYRSTMIPGTCAEQLIPRLERVSGKRVGVDFGVCVNPEFLREGSSVTDFFDPPKVVVGASDGRAAAAVENLYEGLGGPRFRVPVEVAEMIKYVDNSFHALKVDFGNEIGAICAALGVDSHAVMDVFLSDTKLNISTAYLRPGFAFGGSCLPKDIRALMHTARVHDVEVPVLANVLVSNETHLRRALDAVIATRRRRIGIFGLSFKSGTDDLRESPMVELAERLLGKGYDVRIYDAHVALSRLVGANRAYLEELLPHIGEILTDDVELVLAESDVLIAGSAEPAVVAALARATPRHTVVDLVRSPGAPDHGRGEDRVVAEGIGAGRR
ncbi:GDP-mannose 6-dehydrogenase [Rhodococcus sp. RD6.2]|uniref:nucleotide sugar dehydrogenase n=1 Tax=Rhodococcus sp. RD6.2 TaxID=260936 RepID=UPI00063B70FA|nr:nucleotide sugar dehydrogenase [Rhodococcus sp. RD6.2]CRK49513.1 GDP-mannose 6-dehydrogenase [Rhodococcus sp. RD6.2]